MTAWEEAEARALRTRGPGALTLTIWQRLRSADIDPTLSLLPARGLAQLHFAGVDLVHLVDALLVAPSGGYALHLAELYSWCRGAHFWVEESARPFLLLLDRLQAAQPAAPAGPPPAEAVTAGPPEPADPAPPEAQAKLDGRYRQWHLLYERLDLKAEAEGLPPDVRRPLCSMLAETYEEFLLFGHQLHALVQAPRASWSRWTQFLAAVNATFHYHLGPRRLAVGRIDAGLPPAVGLPARILAALAQLPHAQRPAGRTQRGAGGAAPPGGGGPPTPPTGRP